MTDRIEDAAARCENVKWKCDHSGFTARCPVHDDHNNSLSVNMKDDKVLGRCHAGCEQDVVAVALGLKDKNIRTPRTTKKRQPERGEGSLPPQTHLHGCTAKHEANNLGCTLADYALLKRLSVDSLRSYGLGDMPYMGSPAIRIPYTDEQGAVIATRFRTALTKGEGGTDDRFRWKNGTKPCLYGLGRLGAAREAGYVILVEGESDCHTLWHHDIPAVGLPGATNWNEARDASHFDGIAIIYVVIEPDTGGEAVRRWLATSRIRDRARLVSMDAARAVRDA